MRRNDPHQLTTVEVAPRVRRRVVAAVTAVAAVGVSATVTGCSGGGAHPRAVTTTPPPTTAPTASATTTALSTALDAVTALHDKQLPVESVIVYDADTDPGHQIGTGSGYDSRAAFADARLTPGVAATDQQGDLPVGGTVEIYPAADAAGANAVPARQPDPQPGEHDVVSGNVVLRLAPRLTAAEVDTYRIALQEVTGVHATTVS